MWSKTLKTGTAAAPARVQAPQRAAAQPAKPARVLQPGRVPQQLCFEFRRG